MEKVKPVFFTHDQNVKLKLKVKKNFKKNFKLNTNKYQIQAVNAYLLGWLAFKIVYAGLMLFSSKQLPGIYGF